MAYKKSAETRQKIIEAAVKLFKEKGYYDTNIKDIAKEAGVAHPCIYYYFQNKEHIARRIYDETYEKISKTSNEICKDSQDLLLNFMVQYILIFKYIAMNKTTQVVFYDLVQYSNYDKANLERLKNTFFYDVKRFFNEYQIDIKDNQITAYILTSDAFSKALFKGIINGLLDFTLKEAADYFFRHILVGGIEIPEEIYLKKYEDAFSRCESVQPEGVNL